MDMDDTIDLESVALRLERCSSLAQVLARKAHEGKPPSPQTLDAMSALLRGIRLDLHGSDGHLEGSAKERILRYLEQREGEVVHADELAEVAGIHAWARRIRELRDQGYPIEHLGGGRYVMHRGR